MTNGALKLKEMKLCMNLLQQYFSRSTFVIYFFLYNGDKNICDNITWEREKIKFIGILGPMVKLGYFSTFTIHLVLVGMGVSLPSCCDPLCWLMVLRLLFGPSTLIVCGTLTTFFWCICKFIRYYDVYYHCMLFYPHWGCVYPLAGCLNYV